MYMYLSQLYFLIYIVITKNMYTNGHSPTDFDTYFNKHERSNLNTCTRTHVLWYLIHNILVIALRNTDILCVILRNI